jgi:hypothetical protein
MLERAVEAAVGDGFVAGTVVRTVSLPMIDSIEVGLTVTIVGAYFDLVERADARVPVRVHGRVTVGRPSGEPLPISLPPLDVEVRALVEAQLDLGVDQVRLVIDLPGVEFLGASVIGVEGAAPSDPMAQMAQMALAETGDTLFSSLGREVGPVGMDLTGIPVAELGLSPGRAVIRSTDGALTVTIGGVTGETASAHRTPPSREDRIGVSIDADLLGPVRRYPTSAPGFARLCISRDARITSRFAWPLPGWSCPARWGSSMASAAPLPRWARRSCRSSPGCRSPIPFPTSTT